ncbi:MAG: segregation/condensation protein A [Clostridia bacterium]|nr:segregation/condensation protein A [Clostridia bacterium]
MENINYKFELFEGPLELLLSLVEKHKFKIDDIPIDLLCEQYMAYMNEASRRSIDLACEFLYMASELMLIKSRMLLPRDPVKDEDPRQPLIDAMKEYQRAKLAASELSDLFQTYGSRMIKEQDDITPDKTYVADHSVELLKAALIHVFTEVRLNENTARQEFSGIVNAPRIPLESVMSDLIDRLRAGSLYLDQFFLGTSPKKPQKTEVIAKFISILELLKSHIIVLEDNCDPDSGITDVCSHAKITLIGTEEDIKAAALDQYA